MAKLTELLAAIGDDDIGLQNLDTCGISLNMRGGETRITFCTDQPFSINGTDKLGLIVWLDRGKVNAFTAGRLALSQEKNDE